MSSSAAPPINTAGLLWKFTKFEICPNQQEQSVHEYILLEALKHFILNGILYGGINLFYYYLLLSHQNDIIWIIGFCIIIFCDLVIIITHLASLRDAIIYDFNIFFIFNSHSNKPLRNKVSEYIAYHSYYKYEQDQVTECAICREPFTQKTESKILVCGHLFHRNCIKSAEKAQKMTSDTRFGRKCPICRFLYHRQAERWTFNPNYHKDGGILYYQPSRAISDISWNGYKYFPKEMMDYTQKRGKFMMNIAIRMMV